MTNLRYWFLILSLSVASTTEFESCSTCLTSEFDIFNSTSKETEAAIENTALMSATPPTSQSTELVDIITTTELLTTLETAEIETATSNSTGPEGSSISQQQTQTKEVLESEQDALKPTALEPPEILIDFNASNLNDLNDSVSNLTENLFLSFEEWKKVKAEDASSLSLAALSSSTASSVQSSTGSPTSLATAASSGSSNSTSSLSTQSQNQTSPPLGTATEKTMTTIPSIDLAQSPESESNQSNSDVSSARDADSELASDVVSSAIESVEDSTTALQEDQGSSSSAPVSDESGASSSPDLESAASLDLDQGKVYKDKFNYASIDCAATIVKTNSLAKGASAILVENKDSYLLNQCSDANKFVVIELCQDILIESVVVGNFEFFSSMFKNLRLSVSDRFPTVSWEVLGEFEAENIRDIQTFNIVNPLIWARYLKIEILTHYGNEFYCPMSVVRVHGKTMMEEFKMAEEEQQQLLQQQQQLQLQQQQQEEERAIAEKIDVEQFKNISTPNTSEECAVVLPHLGILEFLKDMNATQKEDLCYIDDGEIDSNQTSSSSSSPPVPPSEASSIGSSIAPTEIKTIQESIYKNIMKRLSLLESNASLSLLYVEEQSKLLSSAFTKLERRQANNFQSLVDSFISTMTKQLNYFKDSYVNTQVETSKLIKKQEEEYKELIEESRDRILVLGNELRFQKRLALFNSILIIILLVYVMLTKEIFIAPQEKDDDATEKGHKKSKQNATGHQFSTRPLSTFSRFPNYNDITKRIKKKK